MPTWASEVSGDWWCRIIFACPFLLFLLLLFFLSSMFFCCCRLMRKFLNCAAISFIHEHFSSQGAESPSLETETLWRSRDLSSQPKANSPDAVVFHLTFQVMPGRGMLPQWGVAGHESKQRRANAQAKANKVICFWIWNNLVFVYGTERESEGERERRLGGSRAITLNNKILRGVTAEFMCATPWASACVCACEWAWQHCVSNCSGEIHH